MIDKIKDEMRRQNITKAELARRMKGNTATRQKDLTSILKGDRDPGRELLEEIAEGLGVEWNLQ